MSGETLIVVLVLGAVAIGVIVWLIQVTAGSILAFTYFVMGLPTILVILMFIIFPPTLIVFLIGLALIQLGIADAMFGEKKGTAEVIQANSGQAVSTEPGPFDVSSKRIIVASAIAVAIFAGIILWAIFSKGT